MLQRPNNSNLLKKSAEQKRDSRVPGNLDGRSEKGQRLQLRKLFFDLAAALCQKKIEEFYSLFVKTDSLLSKGQNAIFRILFFRFKRLKISATRAEKIIKLNIFIELKLIPSHLDSSFLEKESTLSLCIEDLSLLRSASS